MDRQYIYIYGIGHEYNKFSSVIAAYSSRIKVMGLVTTHKEYEYFDGYPCISANELPEKEFDYIVLAVVDFKDVYNHLLDVGVTKEKIILSKVFLYPNFDLDEYIKLKNSNVSILSNFCTGGIIYSELGLEQLSPTINMYCPGMGFIKFLSEYEKYLRMPMQQYDNENYIADGLSRESFMPKGIINNEIIWHFNHDVTAKQAINRWNEKRLRVNFENIVAIMICYTDEQAYAFDKLPISKKIGIYYKDLKLDSVICVRGWDDMIIRKENLYYWNGYAMNKIVQSRKEVGIIDWIKFLNGNKEFVRIRY